jgi:hypothetical protein
MLTFAPCGSSGTALAACRRPQCDITQTDRQTDRQTHRHNPAILLLLPNNHFFSSHCFCSHMLAHPVTCPHRPSALLAPSHLDISRQQHARGNCHSSSKMHPSPVFPTVTLGPPPVQVKHSLRCPSPFLRSKALFQKLCRVSRLFKLGPASAVCQCPPPKTRILELTRG